MYQGKLTKGTENSAGYDLHSVEDLEIAPWSRKLVPTGVRLNLKNYTFGLIKGRSGLSLKGIDVAAGVIDSDYSLEVKVVLVNNSDNLFKIEKNMRIAQLIILPYLDLEEGKIEDKEHKGFGSTGN